jgi:hypothetical protein
MVWLVIKLNAKTHILCLAHYANISVKLSKNAYAAKCSLTAVLSQMSLCENSICRWEVYNKFDMVIKGISYCFDISFWQSSAVKTLLLKNLLLNISK